MKRIYLEEGTDVSEILGIIHYEKPVPVQMRGQVRGNFPSNLVSKTDEERIQNIPEILNELKGVQVYSTVKLDGTSATYLLYNGDYQVCSRNTSYKLIDDNKDNIYLRISEKYNIKEVLEKIGKNLAVQGEIVGPGIQKNRLGLKEIDFYVFNVYDIDKREYLDFEMLKMFRDATGMKLVPIIEVFELNHTIDELLEMAKGFYDGTKNHREGIVIRPVNSIKSNILKGDRASFKIINNEFLLKEKE